MPLEAGCRGGDSRVGVAVAMVTHRRGVEMSKEWCGRMETTQRRAEARLVVRTVTTSTALVAATALRQPIPLSIDLGLHSYSSILPPLPPARRLLDPKPLYHPLAPLLSTGYNGTLHR